MAVGKRYFADRSENALTTSPWFVKFWGYSTAFPVQFKAVLRTGQFVDFWARGRSIILTVAEDEGHFERDMLLARYKADAVVDEGRPFGASLITSEEVLKVLEPWLKRIEAGDYLMQT